MIVSNAGRANVRPEGANSTAAGVASAIGSSPETAVGVSVICVGALRAPGETDSEYRVPSAEFASTVPPSGPICFDDEWLVSGVDPTVIEVRSISSARVEVTSHRQSSPKVTGICPRDAPLEVSGLAGLVSSRQEISTV